ncbi:hypothetical protein B4110_2097 [Parageobacillus toebii]|uniref:Uncharacterized protein n=1 Tax=Parageobacillus toebii TaxID=153151 RepID=A0A150N7A9_9BACL|nr:hypothetical protein B4110_2097 [Parageobacillus toebii]
MISSSPFLRNKKTLCAQAKCIRIPQSLSLRWHYPNRFERSTAELAVLSACFRKLPQNNI